MYNFVACKFLMAQPQGFRYYICKRSFVFPVGFLRSLSCIILLAKHSVRGNSSQKRLNHVRPGSLFWHLWRISIKVNFDYVTFLGQYVLGVANLKVWKYSNSRSFGDPDCVERVPKCRQKWENSHRRARSSKNSSVGWNPYTCWFRWYISIDSLQQSSKILLRKRKLP